MIDKEIKYTTNVSWYIMKMDCTIV